MYTARLLNLDEIDLVKLLFEVDSSIVKKNLDPTELTSLIQFLKEKSSQGIAKVSMTFDENNNPYGVHVGYEIPKINGWIFGLTKVKQSNNHYYKTASAMSASVNLLINHMEQRGYYKFWSHTTQKRHDYRTKIMCKFSENLSRYDHYDELVIPRGELSNVIIWDMYRPIINWSDVLVKMFVLRQEFRVRLIKEKNYVDYVGS